MSGEGNDLCRVVLVTPHRTMDLALPERVPLADLMPVLVDRATTAGFLRGSSRGKGLTGEGDWVLQRLGSAPFNEDMTPAALQIREGEALYLRPREAQLPPAHFDDLIDGIAGSVRNRRDRWRDSMTRALFLGICMLILGACFALLLDPAMPGRAPLAGILALLSLLGALLCSRALGDAWAGVALGVAATAFAALMGFLVPPASSTLTESIAPNLLAASVAASSVATLAMAVTGGRRPVFVALWLICCSASLATLLLALQISAVQSAAAVAALVLMASTFAPSVAFRLARLRLPQLPTGAADLADDIEPYPGTELMEGAAIAHSYLTWIFGAVGVIGTACVAIIMGNGSTVRHGFVAAVSLVLILRSRGLTSGWQRVSTLVPALLGLVLLAVHLGDSPDPLRRAAAIFALLLLAGVMLTFSRTMPGRRLPHWGRIAELAEYIAALAMVLLLLAVFDAYAWARALAG